MSILQFTGIHAKLNANVGQFAIDIFLNLDFKQCKITGSDLVLQ